MNGDLISRSALLKELCNSCDGWCDNTECDCLNCKSDHRCDMVVVIAESPAVDAVALPCKVGDTVWGIRNYKGVKHPQQGKVDQMYYTNDMRLHIKIKHICIGEWGKKIFLTREEAEAALKRRADHETD